MKLEVGINGLEEALASLSSHKIEGLLETILNKGQAVLLSRLRARYLAEKDPDLAPWVKSRAAITRASIGVGGGTLFDSGTLFHSIQATKDSTGARKFGTDVPYAEKYQFGIGVIQRKILGWNIDDINAVKTVAQYELRRALGL